MLYNKCYITYIMLGGVAMGPNIRRVKDQVIDTAGNGKT